MIILIDAYNILKYMLAKNYVSDQQRAWFINQMKAYAKKKGHGVVVVFDGGGTQWPTSTTSGNLTVVYAGDRSSADDYIKNYMNQNRQRELVLISTDRELGRAAHALEVVTVDAQDFVQLLALALGEGKAATKPKLTALAIKTTQAQEKELDALMEQIGKVEQKVEENNQNLRITKRHKPSKQERKINQKIKKL